MAPLPQRTRQAMAALDFNEDAEPQAEPSERTLLQDAEDAGVIPGDPLHGLMARLADLDRRLGEPLKPALDDKAVQTIANTMARTADRVIAQRAASLSWRTALIAAVVLAASAGAGLGGGYLWGYGVGQRSVQATQGALAEAFRDGPDAARAWLDLMRQNDPIRTLKACRTREQGGRPVGDCSIWLGDGRRPP